MKVFLNFTLYKNSKEVGVINIDNSGESTLGEFLVLALKKYNSSTESNISEKLIDYKNNVYELKKYSQEKDTIEVIELDSICKNLKNFNFAVEIKPLESSDTTDQTSEVKKVNNNIDDNNNNVVDKPKPIRVKNYEIETKESAGICCCLKSIFK